MNLGQRMPNNEEIGNQKGSLRKLKTIFLLSLENNLVCFGSHKWTELNPTIYFLKCQEIGTGGAEICKYFVTINRKC